jgi:hypothetical protein
VGIRGASAGNFSTDRDTISTFVPSALVLRMSFYSARPALAPDAHAH